MPDLLRQAADGGHDPSSHDPPERPRAEDGQNEPCENDIEQRLFMGLEFILVLYQHIAYAVDFLCVGIKGLVVVDQFGESFIESGVAFRDGVCRQVRSVKPCPGIQARGAAIFQIFVQNAIQLAMHFFGDQALFNEMDDGDDA